jgi:hypothetical protein
VGRTLRAFTRGVNETDTFVSISALLAGRPWGERTISRGVFSWVMVMHNRPGDECSIYFVVGRTVAFTPWGQTLGGGGGKVSRFKGTLWPVWCPVLRHALRGWGVGGTNLLDPPLQPQ